MGSGTSSRSSNTTPIYGAYDGSRDQTVNWNLKEISNFERQNIESESSGSLSISISDSNQTNSDETSNKDENDSTSRSGDEKKPKKVRFANVVTVSRGSSDSIETAELSTADDDQNSWQDEDVNPDVLRIHMENGQIKSIRYDKRTTVVSQIIKSLKDKVKFSTPDFYGLAIVRRSDDGQEEITVQDSDDNIHDKVAFKLKEEIGARCCLRVVFLPQELNELLARDPETFGYLYTQCCNDVVEERFAADLRWKEVLNLSALHLLQWATDEKIHRSKVIRCIEYNWDLSPFVPKSLLRNLPEKRIRKSLIQLIRLHLDCFQNSFQLKLEYLRRIARLKSFGSREYRLVTSTEKILIGPKSGIQLLMESKLFHLARFSHLASVTVDNRTESLIPNRTTVMIELKEQESKNHLLRLSLSTFEVDDFIARLRGYYALHSNRTLPLRNLEDIPVNFSSEAFIRTKNSCYEDRFHDRYYGPQVTRRHLCQLSCGYSPKFEDVVNHLQRILPSKTSDSSALILLQNEKMGTELLEAHDSETLIQAFSNVNRWLKSQQSDTLPWHRLNNYYHSDEDLSNDGHIGGTQRKHLSLSVEDEKLLRNFFNLEHVSKPVEEVNCCDLQNSRSNENDQPIAELLPPPMAFSDIPKYQEDIHSEAQFSLLKPPKSFEKGGHHNPQLFLIPPPEEFSSEKETDLTSTSSSPPLTPHPSKLTFDLSPSPPGLLPPPLEFASPSEATSERKGFELDSGEFISSFATTLKESVSKLRIKEVTIPGLDKL